MTTNIPTITDVEPTADEVRDAEIQAALGPGVLDLVAASTDSPHMPVTVPTKYDDSGVPVETQVYYMPGRKGLSMSAREELRLIMIGISQIQEAPGNKDGSRTDAQNKAIDDFEIRMCQLALPKCSRKHLVALPIPARNMLIETFFTTVDVSEVLRTFQRTVQMQQLLARRRVEEAQQASTLVAQNKMQSAAGTLGPLPRQQPNASPPPMPTPFPTADSSDSTSTNDKSTKRRSRASSTASQGSRAKTSGS